MNMEQSVQDSPLSQSSSDEHITRTYSHDYENDTTLEYSRSGQDSTLRLSFTSEDPDMGTEELLYHGDSGESMEQLAVDLRAEISAFLDAQDHSSFYQQQGLADGIHSEADFYGEYARTTLYAFEGLLKEVEYEVNPPVKWQAIEPEKKDWLYSNYNQNDVVRGTVGHLRVDFGRSGEEFWSSWFDHQPHLKNQAFRDELQTVVDSLRAKGGLLHDFNTMRQGCQAGLKLDDGSYGFRAETKDYEYCLRCIPRRGDYNAYLHCQSKAAQREHTQEKPSLREQLKAETPQRNPKTNHTKKEMER